MHKGPLFYPANNVNPAYGLENVIRHLATNPDFLDAEEYVVARNGAVCIGIKQAIFVYDGNGPVPATSQRQLPIKTAIKEIIGYMRGYTNIKQFNAIGVHTWDKDATENQSWLNNPNRKGEGDIGIVYGALARNLVGPNDEVLDLVTDIIQKLRAGNYNRRLILNYYDPFVRGALPACMYEHAFTVHKGRLNVTSTQRSCDGSLGGAFNQVQAYFLMHYVAAATGYQPGWVQHNVHDLHIYANQIDAIKAFTENEPYPATVKLTIGPKVNKFTPLEELDSMPIDDIFTIEGYRSHGKYEIPLTV